MKRTPMAAGAAASLLASLALVSVAIASPSLREARQVVAHGTVTGRVTQVSGSLLIVQARGRRGGVVPALVAAANKVTRQDYPYVYGGGHSHAGTASVGIPGSGYNGRRHGYDCSGSVAAVLVGGGLWAAGTGVPADNGIISQLRSERLISRGAGHGPVEVTLYDDPGVHIFMSIDGRFFGTSDGGGGGDRRGGPGWLNDGAPDATSHVYERWHFKTSVLHSSAGQEIAFDLGNLAALSDQLQVGQPLRIAYKEARSGLIVATSVAPPDGRTTSGTVTSVAPDGSTFTIQKSGAETATFSTAQDPAVPQLSVGESVVVSYTRHGSTLNARLVSVNGGSYGPPGGGWGGGWHH